MKDIFVCPEEIAFSNEASKNIQTTVGACVAVCIWDEVKKCGGVCHCLLPSSAKSTNVPSIPNGYGQYAIINLLKRFKKHGSEQKNLQAKILGGARVGDTELRKEQWAGQHNIELAKRLLSDFQIPIVANATGGFLEKKIKFNPKTGKVLFQDIEGDQPVETPEMSTITEKKKIKILIVDDSAPTRKILRKMIEKSMEFKVIAEANDPIEAKTLIARDRPDVITLDINMPIMNGIDFLESYIKTSYIPTVIISSLNPRESNDIFKSLSLGAFDYIEKPSFNEINDLSSHLHNTLKAAFQTKPQIDDMFFEEMTGSGDIPILDEKELKSSLIVIGASTGGIEALQAVLSPLPEKIPAILVVQHIPKTFSAPFADRLDKICKAKVCEASDGMLAQEGHIYIAPGGRQMKLIQSGNTQLTIIITDDPPLNRFQPSVDYLFSSVLKVHGKNITAVLLTGMGCDGAKELLSLKEKGAYTIAQDEKTSVVYGMAKVAEKLGGVTKSLPLKDISKAMIKSLKM